MSQSHSFVSRSLFAWIDEAQSEKLPKRMTALHFNLYDGTDSVLEQLIGADSFETGEAPERDNWPVSETFTTGEEIFAVAFYVAGSGCRQWLATC